MAPFKLRGYSAAGVRDYIHVMDLAEGHVSALKYCGVFSSESMEKESKKEGGAGGQGQYVMGVSFRSLYLYYLYCIHSV